MPRGSGLSGPSGWKIVGSQSQVECNFCSLVRMESEAHPPETQKQMTAAVAGLSGRLAKLRNEFCFVMARGARARARVWSRGIGNVISMDEMPEKSKWKLISKLPTKEDTLPELLD